MNDIATPDARVTTRRAIRLNLAAGVWLPLLAVLSVAGFILLGALPGAELSPDLINRLSALPVLCVQAGCAIVMAAGFNYTCSWDPARGTEAGWHDLALAGNADAKWLLIRNDLRWAYLLTLFLAFFWPVR